MATNRLSIGVNFSILLSLSKTIYVLVVAYYSSFKAHQLKNTLSGTLPIGNSNKSVNEHIS